MFFVNTLCTGGLLIAKMKTMIDQKFINKEIFLGKIDNLLDGARKTRTDEDSIGQKIFFGKISDWAE